MLSVSVGLGGGGPAYANGVTRVLVSSMILLPSLTCTEAMNCGL